TEPWDEKEPGQQRSEDGARRVHRVGRADGPPKGLGTLADDPAGEGKADAHQDCRWQDQGASPVETLEPDVLNKARRARWRQEQYAGLGAGGDQDLEKTEDPHRIVDRAAPPGIDETPDPETGQEHREDDCERVGAGAELEHESEHPRPDDLVGERRETRDEKRG